MSVKLYDIFCLFFFLQLIIAVLSPDIILYNVG